jgi:hypothetical protein
VEPRRRLRIAGLVSLIAAAAAAAILLNLALLGYAQPRNDPVGKLSPRAILEPATPAPVTTDGGDRHRGDEHDD